MKLNIQLFATSGTITGSSTASNCNCRIVWTETSRNNTTGSITIKASTQIYKSGSGSTSGTFSGTLSINGTSYSISKSFSSYSWGKWAEVGNKTVTIANASNKKVSISTSLTQTGTSMAGTYKASGTAQLDTLYDPPIINSISMEETNRTLIGRIQNIDIVENASVKTFTLDATFDNNTSLLEWSIKNGSNVFTSTTNKITIDFGTFTLEKINDTTASFEVTVKDTNNSIKNDTLDDYNVIPYTKISIVETSTYVKRAGQTTGDAYLNLYGTFYNNNIGTLTNSINISYRLWKYDDDEIIYADIDPSSIMISNNQFMLTNYSIGNTSSSSPNYLNPSNAYRVEIIVNDSLSIYNSAEKTIPRGVALWTEYEDRVDFKKLTVGGQEILPITQETGDLSFTKSSGNSTITGTYIKYGKVVNLNVNITTTGNTAAGSDVWSGTINNFEIPVGGALVGYIAQRAIIGSINTSKSFTIRNASASQVGSGGTCRIRGTIIIE